MWEMEKIAWRVTADKRRHFMGFLSPKEWKEKGHDSEE
jgi:hypothetical protein